VENEKKYHSHPKGRDQGSRPQMDPQVKQAIDQTIETLRDTLNPYVINGFNAFQRKQVYRYFERMPEYGVKSYRHEENFVMKIYPVGGLKRLAEQRAQEVLMHGEPEILPPMGSYERFVIHTYLKDRGGVRTESEGEGNERHIVICPIFGRTLKKAKRRLT
jgi:hypothetical protein